MSMNPWNVPSMANFKKSQWDRPSLKEANEIGQPGVDSSFSSLNPLAKVEAEPVQVFTVVLTNPLHVQCQIWIHLNSQTSAVHWPSMTTYLVQYGDILWGKNNRGGLIPSLKKWLLYVESQAIHAARIDSPRGSHRTSYWDHPALQHWGLGRSIQGPCLCSPWPAPHTPWGRRTPGGARQSPTSPAAKISFKTSLPPRKLQSLKKPVSGFLNS